MNKIIIAILICFAISKVEVYSQSKLGVRGSFLVSSMSSGESKSRPGFNLGAILDTPISDSWHFQPSFLFSLNGTKAADKMKLDYSAYFYAIETPLLLSYRMGDDEISFGLDMGIFCRYGFSGGYWTDTSDKGRIKPDIFDHQKQFDMGTQAGFSVIAQGVYMGCGLQYGLIKPWKERRGNYYNYFISFGYLFEL